jgi:CheY-like chemotaxis protein
MSKIGVFGMMMCFKAMDNGASGRPVLHETKISKGPASSMRVLRILLAEDNILDQKIAIAILRKLGHSVDIVDNGAQAILAVGMAVYDLVIMDVQMPELDGIQAVKRIRNLFGGDLKIIFVTASSPDTYRCQCIEAGGNDFICKPLDFYELNAAIRRATE